MRHEESAVTQQAQSSSKSYRLTQKTLAGREETDLESNAFPVRMPGLRTPEAVVTAEQLSEQEKRTAVVAYLQEACIPFLEVKSKARDGNIAGLNLQHSVNSLKNTIFDQNTLANIELQSALSKMQYYLSYAGNHFSVSALLAPPADYAVTIAKQEAAKELVNNRELRLAWDAFVKLYDKLEVVLVDLVDGPMPHTNVYSYYWKVQSAALKIVDEIEKLPEANSVYLQELAKPLRDLKNSHFIKLLKEGIHRTPTGLKAPEEVDAQGNSRFSFKSWRFWPFHLSPGTVALCVPAIATGLGGLFLTNLSSFISFTYTALVTGVLASASLMFSFCGGKERVDFQTVIEPLNDEAKKDRTFNQFFDSVGRITEILNYANLALDYQDQTSFPEVVDANYHFIEVTDLGLTKELDNPSFRKNGLKLFRNFLTIFSGPNSGGKSTICKGTTQLQAQAQNGGPVVGKDVVVGMADKVFYSGKQTDTTNDLHGGFGESARPVRNAFYKFTPKTFVILDEPGSGTGHQERKKFINDRVEAFSIIGGTIVVVTHDHEWAKGLVETGICEGLQFEFKGSRPTYRLLKGVAKSSHAEAIAADLHFGEEDVWQHLINEGYIEEQ